MGGVGSTDTAELMELWWLATHQGFQGKGLRICRMPRREAEWELHFGKSKSIAVTQPQREVWEW